MRVFLSVILIIGVVAFAVWNIYGIIKDIVAAKRKKRKNDNKQDNNINKE